MAPTRLGESTSKVSSRFGSKIDQIVKLIKSFSHERNVLIFVQYDSIDVEPRAIQSVVATGGVYKGQGRNQPKLMTCAYWEFLVEEQELQCYQGLISTSLASNKRNRTPSNFGQEQRKSIKNAPDDDAVPLAVNPSILSTSSGRPPKTNILLDSGSNRLRKEDIRGGKDPLSFHGWCRRVREDVDQGSHFEEEQSISVLRNFGRSRTRSTRASKNTLFTCTTS